jgi:hypothetical protein
MNVKRTKKKLTMEELIEQKKAITESGLSIDAYL